MYRRRRHPQVEGDHAGPQHGRRDGGLQDGPPLLGPGLGSAAQAAAEETDELTDEDLAALDEIEPPQDRRDDRADTEEQRAIYHEVTALMESLKPGLIKAADRDRSGKSGGKADA